MKSFFRFPVQNISVKDETVPMNLKSYVIGICERTLKSFRPDHLQPLTVLKFLFEMMHQGRNTKGECRLNGFDRKNKQGFVDIKNMTATQLKELIERQNKLLQNRLFLEKLPDKGMKILLFKTELEANLKEKQEEYEETCQLMLNLNLSDKNAEEIEWNKGTLNICASQLDSDDDDDDDSEDKKVFVNPLKMLATHSGTASGRKIINLSETKLIAESEYDNNKDKKNFYIDKICEKSEKSNKGNCKERFKPNQLKNNDKTLFKTSAEKVKSRLGDKWEITEATPPVPIYRDTVMISLNESLKLQKEQAEKLKEIEKKNATEKLLQTALVKMGNNLPLHNVTEYRNSSDIFAMSNEDSENEFNESDSEENVLFMTNNGADN